MFDTTNWNKAGTANEKYMSFKLDLTSQIARLTRPGMYWLSCCATSIKGTGGASYNQDIARVCLRADVGTYASIIGETDCFGLSYIKYRGDKVWNRTTDVIYIDEQAIADAKAGKSISLCLDSMNGAAVQYIYFDQVRLENAKDVKQYAPEKATTWKAVEFTLLGKPSKTFDNYELEITATNAKADKTITQPGFWNGGAEYGVRIALPEAGVWSYTISGTALETVQTGTIKCVAASASDPAIYQHGFVTVPENGKYFTYADGNPFYYVADTHWNIIDEIEAGYTFFEGYEEDSSMPSGYKYTGSSNKVRVHLVELMAKTRASQGYTVVQTQPGTSGETSLLQGFTQGITGSDNELKYFSKLDKSFKIIAEQGLVNVNSQLFFPGTIKMLIPNYGGMDTTKPVAYYRTQWTTDEEKLSEDFKSPVMISEQEYESIVAQYNSSSNNGRIVHEIISTLAGYERYIVFDKEIGNYEECTEYLVRYDFSNEFYSAMNSFARYWVARYGAYPTMWSLGQEADNAHFFNRREVKDNATIIRNGETVKDTGWYALRNCWSHSPVTNPYVLLAEGIASLDPYQHPLTCHQEGSAGVYGSGITTPYYKAEDAGKKFSEREMQFTYDNASDSTTNAKNSIFLDISGHSFYGAQLSPIWWNSNSFNYAGQYDTDLSRSKDYYLNSGKPAVNYEPRYLWLDSDNFNMRYRAWYAFMNGFAGFAFGANDTWSYQSSYNIYAHRENSHGGNLTTEILQYATYLDSLNANSGSQVAYIKNFFTESGINLSTLSPAFGDTSKFDAASDDLLWSMMRNDNAVVVYFGDCSIVNSTYHKADFASSTYKDNATSKKTYYDTVKSLSSHEKAVRAANLSTTDKLDISIMRDGGYNLPLGDLGSTGSERFIAPDKTTRSTNVTGTVKGLTNGDYTVGWFNPITGQWYDKNFVECNNANEITTIENVSNGTYAIGAKPVGHDFVFYMVKN